MSLAGLHRAALLELEQLGVEHGIRRQQYWREWNTHREGSSSIDVRLSDAWSRASHITHPTFSPHVKSMSFRYGYRRMIVILLFIGPNKEKDEETVQKKCKAGVLCRRCGNNTTSM